MPSSQEVRVQQEAVAIEQWAEKYRIPDFPQPLPVQYNVRNTRVAKNSSQDSDVTGFSSNGAATRLVHDCVEDGKDCCIEFELNGTQRLKYSATQLRYDEIGSKGMKNTILTYCSRHDMTAIYVGITNNVAYPLFCSLDRGRPFQKAMMALAPAEISPISDLEPLSGHLYDISSVSQSVFPGPAPLAEEAQQ